MARKKSESRGGGMAQYAVTPEQHLWCAVVERACRDSNSEAGGQSQSRPSPVDRRQVRGWATSRDAMEVCDMAGVDWSRVRDYIIEKTADLA